VKRVEFSTVIYRAPSGSIFSEVIDDRVTKKQRMLPTIFECVACGLKISGFSKLTACGLDDALTVKSTYSAADFFGLSTEDELEDARNTMPALEPDNKE